MRVCAIHLPELRIELLASTMSIEDARAPLAAVVAPPPLTELKLLGNTRLSVVSLSARALGIHPGQTIAQARARAAHLSVRVVRPDAVRDVLSCIAEVGLAFGATVSFGMADSDRGYGDVVWIDVTGCAHLHGSSIFDGETVLAARLAGVIGGLGYTCSIAIADGPRVAAMLGRAGYEAGMKRGRYLRYFTGEPIVVRPGANAAAIASLGVAALPLPPEDIRWLAKIGVRTVEELRALPRDGLGTRLGARAREVLALAEGDDRAPLTPYLPPEIPEEETELEYGIEGTQALTFVAKTLTDRLSARLQGRAVAAARLELELRLDAAMIPKGEAVIVTALDLPAPLGDASDLLAALRPKIERLVLAAPVLGARLRAPVLVHKRAAALALFTPQPKAERALPRLVAELVADLGPNAVSSLVLGDGWSPEDRSKIVPFELKKKTTKKTRRLLSSVPEPTRLCAAPVPIAREGVRITRHLARIEAVDWWKAPPVRTPGRSPVDYVQAWTEDGAAWVEIDRASGNMFLRGWFD